MMSAVLSMMNVLVVMKDLINYYILFNLSTKASASSTSQTSVAIDNFTYSLKNGTKMMFDMSVQVLTQ